MAAWRLCLVALLFVGFSVRADDPRTPGQLTLTTPEKATGPVPVIMEFGFNFGGKGGLGPKGGGKGGPNWQEQLLTKGWGYAIITPTSVQADNGGMTGKNGTYQGLTTGI